MELDWGYEADNGMRSKLHVIMCENWIAWPAIIIKIYSAREFKQKSNIRAELNRNESHRSKVITPMSQGRTRGRGGTRRLRGCASRRWTSCAARWSRTRRLRATSTGTCVAPAAARWWTSDTRFVSRWTRTRVRAVCLCKLSVRSRRSQKRRL